MGRLIDADDIEFKKKFCKRFCTNLADVTTCERKENCGIMEWIDNQPTAYDVDKVAIEISDYFQSYIRNCNLTEEEALTMLYMEEHITKLTKGAVKDE